MSKINISLISLLFSILSLSYGHAGDIAYGEYLASECVTCHVPSNDIPPIKGIDKAHFIEAMNSYKTGERSNEVMQSVAKSLGEEEIESLAEYLYSLDPAY